MASGKKGKMGIAAGVIVLLAAAAIWGYPAVTSGYPVKMSRESDRIVVTGERYEIAFSAKNGGIESIRGRGAKEALSAGNRGGALWWGFAGDEGSWNGAQASDFSYEWHSRAKELVFHYGGPLKVDATVAFGRDGRIRMRANVVNGTGLTIESFRFPYELKVPADRVQDGLLPMLPGALLTDAFFKENNSFSAPYPGVMFAAYEAVRTDHGSLALYDVHGKTAETANLGFKNQVDDAGKTALVHDYSVVLAPNAEWTTPDVVLDIGGDYAESIGGYGELNGFSDYPSLRKKLGKDWTAYASLPFYKMDISAFKNGSWHALKTDYADRLPYPGVLHLVGFQTGGHDENYPDFLPPDPKWGSDADFRDFVRSAKEKGDKVVPYTNFSWWGVSSPTLQKLPPGTSLEDVVALQKNGTVIKEDYGPHSGYVVNPAHPFVRQRIAEEHGKLLKEAGFDGIFEDQWGIRNAPALYNKSAPEGTNPANAYFQGVRDYFASLDFPMFTEDGIDVLAADATGFMGTNLLWDVLDYRKNTASYTEYYPMAGMLLRDKVLLYQHDLAAETMTDDPEMLRWNLAMGYNLSADLYNGVTNPWVDAVGVIQREVLSGYADEKVRSYERVTPDVTRTGFGSRTVTANWNRESVYALDDAMTLSPGGFDVAAADGNVRAGNYARYNGLDLDPGEHVLVEVRKKDAIRVYQPYGSDTTLRIRKGGKWAYVAAAAYEADGTKIADLAVSEDGDFATFDYIANILDRKVGCVELLPADRPSDVKASFRKVKLLTNLALEKGITATSSTADAFDADKANDGDPFTYWESTNKKFPQSLTLDLGETTEVGKLMLRLVPQDAWEKRDQEIAVLGSADGQTFATLVPPAAYAFDPASENKIEIPIDPPGKVRYVRLTVTGNTAWPAAQISEFEVYGKS
ncbi:discoidin domain-containing protein [Cohnella caldifontis]|uniref:discoidin domain-containing protein n=1 Tax=Cohnella caldifontis TaxID=3027471 RepID=UPI0023EA9A5E|nr:discoidin domain-containing protein [Cohnella sp. YIM B05605]